MLKLITARVFSTAVKGANIKLSKADVIKRLNYENKALFGAVVKPAKKKRKATTQNEPTPQTPGVETEYSSEMYWQSRNVSRMTESKATGEKAEDSSPAPAELPTPFSEQELHSITKFPLLPSGDGIFERNWIRHEQHESDRYESPSVNRVLAATMPETSRQALLRWKTSKIAELGEEGFQQLQKEIFARGSTLHSTLETWLSGSDPTEAVIDRTGMLWKSIHGALEHVERPAKIVEQKLYHPYLHYNGVVDCVTSIRGEYHVIEWKTSDNAKATVAATYDAPIQLCAYLGALQANDELRDSRVRNGAIFVAYTSGKPADVHMLNGAEVRRHWKLWLNRLQEYWTRYRDAPTKECQYGGDCYRVNPVHFREFSHPHIEKLLAKAASISLVEIPDNVKVNKSVFTEQLKIVSSLFPHLSCDSKNPEKKTKTEQPQMQQVPSTSALPGSASVPKSEPKPSSSSALENKKAIESLFAERRAKMQAAAPPANQPAPVVPQKAATTTTESTGVSLKQAIPRDINAYFPVVAPRGRMAQKLAAAAPYNYFLTTITDSKPTHTEPLSLTFQELLDVSLGELECSVQMNFMVDIGWLLAHYFFAGYENVPLLILYGDETPELRMVSKKKPNVTAVKVDIKTPFGVHHTKMGLYGYRDGSMRVVISTANLYEDDWHNRTQGLWVSPRLPVVPEGSDTTYGESRTDFRASLLAYLDAYKLPHLYPWLTRIRKTDFSDVRVFLVASVPGGHVNTPKGPLWGHPRLGHLLAQHAAPIDDSCPLVAQSSSIGSLGPSPESWVLGEIMASFRRDSAPVGIRRLPGFRMIYPSFSNVRQSHDGMLGGGCLPYGKSTHVKQEWLKAYLHQWSSRTRHRNKAMPHIKTYCRWSHRGLYWFLLTSANLSKSAWGVYNKTGRFEKPLRINSYEAGVLFLPKIMLIVAPVRTPTMMQTPEQETAAELSTPVATEQKSPASATDTDVEKLFHPVIAPRGKMAEKLAAAAPYHFFLTTIADSEPTHTEPLSITFQELLDPSLGELECSVQMTYLCDPSWVLYHYGIAGYATVPLLLLHGSDLADLCTITQTIPNVTVLKIDTRLDSDFGVHHTKMGLYGYRDGSMRVVISTANLAPYEWLNITQGMWVSPTLPAVPEESNATYGDSVTGFRRSLLAYLDTYELPQLQPWITRIQKTDFTDVKVFFVASVPGEQVNPRVGPMWGHPRLGFLLSLHAAPIYDTCPLVAQSSSVGSFGPRPKSWLLGEFMNSFGKHAGYSTYVYRPPGFCLIYNSYSNVCQGHDFSGGGWYAEEVHTRQQWLNSYLYHWRSHARHRNKAMPHIKTYCRWSDRGLYWFLLTSANCSKSAWGVTRYGKSFRINNYEAGVLFMPNVMMSHVRARIVLGGVLLLALAIECHADTRYNVSFDELHKCKQHNAINGYNYRAFFKLHELQHHNATDPDLLVDLLVYVMAARDGHIYFSENNKTSTSGVEIVLGGGSNTFSQIRYGQKGPPLRTKSSPGLLSPIDPLPLRVRIDTGGQIQLFAGNLTDEPYMETRLPKRVELSYVSFTTWGTALAKWFYDCPLPTNGTDEAPTIDGNELEQEFDGKQRLRDRFLAARRLNDPPANFTGVNVSHLYVQGFVFDQATNLVELSGVLRFSWTDPRYRWNASEYDQTVMLADVCHLVWTPNFESASLFSGAFTLCYITMDGTVVAEIDEFSWVNFCTLADSYRWPYDTNNCQLRLVAAGHERNVPIRLAKSEVEFETDFEQSEWSLKSIVKHEYELTNTPYGLLPALELHIAMDRKSDIHSISIYPSYFVANLLISISFLADGRSRLLLNSLGLIVLLNSFLSLSVIVPRSGVPKIYNFFQCSLVFYTISSILFAIELWLKRTRAAIPTGSWIGRLINFPALRTAFAMDQRGNYNTLDQKNVRWEEVTCMLNRIMMLVVTIVFVVGFVKP
uniref:Mitochondrial genome maintenance exonuclease 1 n=1 Tax=Anopheles dirus TaxID=7168 RepID=A0A182MYE1_9DIPT